MADIALKDIELPDNSVALILTDRQDGTFSTVITGAVTTVPEELLTLIVGAKRLMYSDQKTILDAALDAAGEFELEAADDVTWEDNIKGSA